IIQIERIETDRYPVTREGCVGEIEVITQFRVGASESALGGFFVDGDQTDRRVSAIARDDGGVAAGEGVIIVGLLVDLWASWAAGQRVNNPILLHEGGISSSTITDRPAVIILPDAPREYRWRDSIGGVVKLDIVDAHPIAAPVRIVVDAF